MLNVGDVVEGRYKILDTIDTGGMGTVLLAEHVLIKRRLAIKVLHENLATDSKVVERFMNEASVAGRLGHPNIVESTDMGFTSAHVPFIVFEYLEGVLLTSEIYRVKGLTVRRALKIATQIASALDAAHSAGIVHRDLKSDNIFLVHKEEVVDHVKVLDFGVSRFMAEDAMVVGTPEYMAPEQLVTPDKVDARADIYALGVVLYEMITARRPFRNTGDTEALLHSIVHDPPPPLTRGEAPAGLQEMLFTKLLAKDPAERYQTMKEVQAAIAAFHGITRPTPANIQVPNVDGGAQTVTPVPTPVPTPTPTPIPVAEAVPRAKSYGMPIALIVLGLAAAGAGVGLLVGVPPEKQTTGSASQATIDGDAAQLALAFEAAANANQLRAEGLAMTPMLRAAVETDSVTFRDMIKTGDFTITPRAQETVEIYQRKQGATLMLKIPEDAPSAEPKAGVRYRVRGSEIVAVAGVPVKGPSVEGLVVISSPIDLEKQKAQIAKHALQATIVGLGDPVPLAGAPAEGQKLSAPIKVAGDSRPVLEVVVPVPTITVTDRMATVRLGLWGSGGALLMLGLSILLLRARSR